MPANAQVGVGRRAVEADDTVMRGPIRPQFSQATSSTVPETPVRSRAKTVPCHDSDVQAISPSGRTSSHSKSG